MEGETTHEQWVSGTYIVTGVFPKYVLALSTDQLKADIPAVFELLSKNKKAWWPKGISAYFAIPIYTSDGFNQAVIEWVHSRPQYKYAMWHEPVLYDRKRNMAEINASWGLSGAAYRIFLFEVIYTALAVISQKEGHSEFPLVNGEKIEDEEAHLPIQVINGQMTHKIENFQSEPSNLRSIPKWRLFLYLTILFFGIGGPLLYFQFQHPETPLWRTFISFVIGFTSLPILVFLIDRLVTKRDFASKYLPVIMRLWYVVIAIQILLFIANIIMQLNM